MVVEADHCERVAGCWLFTGTRRYEFAECICGHHEPAFIGPGIRWKQRALNGRLEILNDTRPERYNVFPFEIVRVPDQVARVSHVQEVCGAEILPEPMLHPFDLVDEFSDFQEAEARCIQDGFLLECERNLVGN